MWVVFSCEGDVIVVIVKVKIVRCLVFIVFVVVFLCEILCCVNVEFFNIFFKNEVNYIGYCVGIVYSRCVVSYDFYMFNLCSWNGICINGSCVCWWRYMMFIVN